MPERNSEETIASSAVDRPLRGGPATTTPGPSAPMSMPCGPSSSPPAPTSAHSGEGGIKEASRASVSATVVLTGSRSVRNGRSARPGRGNRSAERCASR